MALPTDNELFSLTSEKGRGPEDISPQPVVNPCLRPMHLPWLSRYHSIPCVVVTSALYQLVYSFLKILRS